MLDRRYCRLNIPCAELYICWFEWLCREEGSVSLALLQFKYNVC